MEDGFYHAWYNKHWFNSGFWLGFFNWRFGGNMIGSEMPIMAFDFKFKLQEKVKLKTEDIEFIGRITGRCQYIDTPDSYYVEIEQDHPANGWYPENTLTKEKQNE